MSEEKSIIGVPAGAGPILSRRDLLLQLAERCETEKPDWRLCGAIEVAVFPGVTWWRGAGPFLCEKNGMPFNPPAYAFSLDAARTLSNWLLLDASDVGADGMPLVVLGDPSTTPARDAKGIGGRTLELTWCAAALRALAAGEMS